MKKKVLLRQSPLHASTYYLVNSEKESTHYYMENIGEPSVGNQQQVQVLELPTTAENKQRDKAENSEAEILCLPEMKF